MPESEMSLDRRQATRGRDNLRSLITKLEARRAAGPSELTVRLRKSGSAFSKLFLWMACTAVAEKYQRADRPDVAEQLWALQAACERWWSALPAQRRSAVEDRYSQARPVQALAKGRKRISQHQSRMVCADLDIVLCANAPFSIELGIVPWVCQQPDLRYRWTDDGIARLGYLADCWAAYADIEPAWQHRTIGLSNFPFHPDYC